MPSRVGVLTPAGQTVLTRLREPFRKHSFAAAFENMQTAALLAE